MKFMTWRVLIRRNIPTRTEIIPNGKDILEKLSKELLIIPETDKEILISVSYLLDGEEVTSYGIYLEAGEREVIYKTIETSIKDTILRYEKRKQRENVKVVAFALTVFYKNDDTKNKTVLLVETRFYRERRWL